MVLRKVMMVGVALVLGACASVKEHEIAFPNREYRKAVVPAPPPSIKGFALYGELPRLLEKYKDICAIENTPLSEYRGTSGRSLSHFKSHTHCLVFDAELELFLEFVDDTVHVSADWPNVSQHYAHTARNVFDHAVDLSVAKKELADFHRSNLPPEGPPYSGEDSEM